VHWFVPLEPSKKGADADKQVELVAEALAEEMAARREQPLYQAPQGLASHSIAAVRLLLRRLALTPALARRKVFIVGDAERLTPQRGMEDAANALLKALEEPPADTAVVLTAADPEALLPTILSRVVRVRVARLVDSVVTDFAQQVLGMTGKAELAQRVSVAEGCIGRLLATEGDSAARSRRAGELLEAGRKGDGGAATRYALALSQMPFQARGGFTEILEALASRLRSEARGGGETRKLIEAIARVMDARELAQGNVNPQLVTAVLAEDLAGAGAS
jgi:DNA polymerase-3 subunit delta'